MADDLIELLHVGPGGCGDVAVCHVGRPIAGDLVDVARLRLLDGTIPPPGDPAVCGTCGARLIRFPWNVRPAGGWAER